jgi:lysophospholipase L1-like esterase
MLLTACIILLLGLLAGYILINVYISGFFTKLLAGLALTLLFDLFIGSGLSYLRATPESPSPFELSEATQPIGLNAEYLHFDGNWGQHLNSFTRATNLADSSINADLLICCYGGSSTYCLKLEESQSWPALLEKNLQKEGYAVEVHNHGIPGLGMADNMHNKLQYGCEQLGYSKRLEIHYHGWNDFRLANIPGLEHNKLQAAINWHIRSTQMMTAQHAVSPNTIAYNYYYMNWISYKKARLINFLEKHTILLSTLLMSLHGYLHQQYNVDSIHQRALHTEQDHPSDTLLAGYFESQLQKLEESGQAYLFVPQILNFSQIEREGRSYAYWMPGITKQRAATYCKRLDSLSRQVLPTHRVFPMDAEEWAPHHFLDYGHFSAEGSQQFAKSLAAFLISQEQI